MISISAENPSGEKFEFCVERLSQAFAVVRDLVLSYDCDTIDFDFVSRKDDDE